MRGDDSSAHRTFKLIRHSAAKSIMIVPSNSFSFSV